MKKLKLTNKERKYFGLDPIKKSWDKLLIPPGKYDEHDVLVFFDENKLVKYVIQTENIYCEGNFDIETENRTYLLPKTKKGKKSNITQANLNNKYSGTGLYFSASKSGIIIGNYSTQTTFYSSYREELSIDNYSDFEKWKSKWIENSDNISIQNITEFKNAKRKHVKYKKGDYFSYKLTRTEYGFGRILENIFLKQKNEKQKDDNNYLNRLMGKNLLIAYYNYRSNEAIVNTSILDNIDLFPSEFNMDNNFFYGENLIFENNDVKDQIIDYPISMHCTKENVYLQWGDLNLKSEKHSIQKKVLDRILNILKSRDDKCFPNENFTFVRTHTNFNIPLKYSTILAIEKSGNTDLYFELERDGENLDLRNPKYGDIKKAIFDELGLDHSKNYIENYEIIHVL